MKKIELHIDGQDDRRTIVAILSDNGYKVKIEKRTPQMFEDEYWILIE